MFILWTNKAHHQILTQHRMLCKSHDSYSTASNTTMLLSTQSYHAPLDNLVTTGN